ncbi:MAG TPA: carboxypeptidase-like regulatory domain-containing protein [Verrucomicrobiae bacterium]|jgi:hypothetical protein|nr:carboxypeptidase-like regulatory domain-containing protein [Verrucomicrobiae bacterium]
MKLARIISCGLLGCSLSVPELLTPGLMAQQRQPSAAPASTGFRIDGTLVDASSGVPLANAVVAIAPVTQRDNFLTMTTAADGRFFFVDLGKGKYTLTAQRRGYLVQSFDQHEQFASSIAVGPELKSTDLLFRLPPEGSIFGKITDEYNDPVANAQVILFRMGLSGGTQGASAQRRAMANDEGSYHFGHLSPGKYYVVVSARPWYAQAAANGIVISQHVFGNSVTTDQTQPAPEKPEPRSPLDVAFPVTFYPGAVDFGSAIPIALGPGERFAADVGLQSVPSLHIHVNAGETAQNRSFGANLTQIVAGDVMVNLSTTMISGGPNAWEIVGIAPGRYNVDFNIQNGRDWSRSTRTIDLTDNAELGSADIPAASPLEGAVSFDNGAKLPARAFFQLRDLKTRQVLSAQISPDGEFNLKQGVPAGSYEVTASVQGAFIRTLAASGAKLTGRILTVSGAAPVKIAAVMSQGAGQITGTALRAGKPAGGVMIVAVPQDPSNNQPLFRRDQSDSDGTFTLAVVPGKFTVLALENGWDMEWANPEVLKPYLKQGEVLQVEPKGKYDIKVQVQP